MNLWYAAGIIFSAFAAICGVIGANQQAIESGRPLEDEISNLGIEIQRLREESSPEQKDSLDKIEERYEKMADEFVKNKHKTKEALQFKRASSESDEISTTQSISLRFDRLHSYSEKLVDAYNNRIASNEIYVSKSSFPVNFFRSKDANPHIILGSANSDNLWVVSFGYFSGYITTTFSFFPKEQLDRVIMFNTFSLENNFTISFKNDNFSLSVASTQNTAEISVVVDQIDLNNDIDNLLENAVKYVVDLLAIDA